MDTSSVRKSTLVTTPEGVDTSGTLLTMRSALDTVVHPVGGGCLGHIAHAEELPDLVHGEGRNLGHITVEEKQLGLVPGEGGHLSHVLGGDHRSAPANVCAAAYCSRSRVCKDTIFKRHKLESQGTLTSKTVNYWGWDGLGESWRELEERKVRSWSWRPCNSTWLLPPLGGEAKPPGVGDTGPQDPGAGVTT